MDANPDGIDLTGPLFEILETTGMITREKATDVNSQIYKAGGDAVYKNTDTAMGYVWIISKENTRLSQIKAGADWLRINLAATSQRVDIQPLSQCLQEYPEMAHLYDQVHNKLAPNGGTVQMFARIGYGKPQNQSPRWTLETKIRNG